MQAAPKLARLIEKCTKPLDQIEGEEETEISPHEDLPSWKLLSHRDVVIRRQTDPRDGETEYSAAKRKHACSFFIARAHGDINEVFGAKTGNDTEHDDHDNPAEPF